MNHMEETEMDDIRSLDLPQLVAWVQGLGEKPYRGRQIYAWLHQRAAATYEEMTDIPAKLREELAARYPLATLQTKAVQESRLDGTRKYLFQLRDGNMVESVLMRYRHGNSVCISSQAGCRMGCRFCASALGGLARNLSPGEMLDQVYRIQADIGERVSNVVVMGTGEPLDNYENLLKFISMLTDEAGLHISQRNLTISTCGIVPNMRKLADRNCQATLALSLHAPNQELRRELMPVAAQYGLAETLDACRYYAQQTGRRVTLEYALLGGVNDSLSAARELASLVKGLGCHVNLIPVNPVREYGHVRPRPDDIRSFKKELEKYGINVTIRRELGQDIDGACGQLRKRYAER